MNQKAVLNSAVRVLLSMTATLAFAADPVALKPGAMPRLATVDERFQSFNVEMVEVTGGRFWAPYKKSALVEAPPAAKLATPGVDPSLFRTREPINLASPRLRKLASALAPSYVRVSGTWANSTFFQDSPGPALKAPPAGFGGVLSQAQWLGVLNFSRAVNAGIITSFAISDGVRGPDGVWTAAEAGKILSFTQRQGGKIAAAELFNEPSFAAMGGAPKGYDAAAYGRDFQAFAKFAHKAAPDMKILGPGSVGEAASLGNMALLHTADLMTATGPGVDIFSYHYYGAVSKRCAAMPGAAQTTADKALSPDWLARTERDAAFYAALRDRFEPGKPMWLTETGETACGGNPWAASFADSFRYLEQLGRLARRGVQVVAHNTLAASDYGLIDEETLTPRPNYWSALLWRRLMGNTVLDSGVPLTGDVHVFAHCMRGHAGGVTLLAINPSATPQTLGIAGAAQVYRLTAAGALTDSSVALNGMRLEVGPGDKLPELKGVAAKGGIAELPASSITFVTVPSAGNAACR